DDGHATDVVVAGHFGRAELLFHFVAGFTRDDEVGLGDRERDVRDPLRTRVLHDHVDVDAPVRELTEESRGHTRTVGHSPHGDLRFRRGIGPGRYDGFFHSGVLLHDPGSWFPGKTRANVQRHAVSARVFDGAKHQDATTRRRDLHHLVERDPRDATRLQ